jgi:hypothetical protein
MEKEFNINQHYDNLVTELFEWYQCQTFESLHKIHNLDINYLFGKDNQELEVILDELREDWNDMGVQGQIDCYNQIMGY